MTDTLTQDLRFAVRSLRRVAGFSAVVIITLTVGIASVTTIFSLVNTAVIRPLPYPAAARTRAISELRPEQAQQFSSVSPQAIELIRRNARSFERVDAYDSRSALLTLPSGAMSLTGTAVDSGLFTLLGARPQIGRLFSPADFAGATPVIVLSDSLWRGTFAADPTILGRSLHINGGDWTVIGILRRGFRFPERSDVWFPIGNGEIAGGTAWYSLLGELRPGTSAARAPTEMQVVSQWLVAANPRELRGATLVLRDGMFERGNTIVRLFVVIFLGAALCVLLVACVNVGNLLLVRAVERSGEMAVRSCLGASPLRLLRQSVAESAVLGLTAGGLGTLASVWGVQLATRMIPMEGIPAWVQFGVDARVLLFALGASLLATSTFGLIPARYAMRLDLAPALGTSGRTGTRGPAAVRSGRRGVVIQIALSFALFIGASLLWRTYQRLAAVDLGYQADRVLAIRPIYDRERYQTARSTTDFARAALEGFATIPGAQHASLRGEAASIVADSATAIRPARGGAASAAASQSDSVNAFFLFFPDATDHPLDRGVYPAPRRIVVSDDYFAALGLRLTRGRGFFPSDNASGAPVAVVSEQFAAFAWHTEEVLGKTIQVGPHGTPITVVGVVSDVREVREGARGTSANPSADLYLSDRQAATYDPEILVQVTGDRSRVEAMAAAAIRRSDRAAAIGRMETLAEREQLSLLPVRIIGSLIGIFAFSAFGLAMLGVYGVLAYSITQRTREIGIRVALGGGAGDIVRLIVRDGLRFVVIGLAGGAVLSIGFARLLRFLLWNASSFDLAAYATVFALFGIIGCLGCYIPARRATRIDPVQALRES